MSSSLHESFHALSFLILSVKINKNTTNTQSPCIHAKYWQICLKGLREISRTIENIIILKSKPKSVSENNNIRG